MPSSIPTDRPGPSRTAQDAPTQEAHDEIDGAVLRRAMQGDRDALEAFVKHYERRLFAFLYRALGRSPSVNDLAQDVFLRALRALPRFEPGRAKVSSWLFQIAVHRLRDEFRQRRASGELLTDTASSRESSPEAGAHERETLDWMQREIEGLPEDQRVALVLFEFHDMSLKEIAEMTNASEPTIKTRVFRAKQKLILAYEKHSRVSQGGRP